MALNVFSVPFEDVALAANVPKTVVGVQAAANVVTLVREIDVYFDGILPTAKTIKVQYGRCTFATSPPGTDSTTTTPQKNDPGRAETIQTACARDWSAEPTVITVYRPKNVEPWNGWNHYIIPFATPFIIPGGQGFVVRCTVPGGGAGVNATGSLLCEE